MLSFDSGVHCQKLVVKLQTIYSSVPLRHTSYLGFISDDDLQTLLVSVKKKELTLS